MGVRIQLSPDDDPAFLALVVRIIEAIVGETRPLAACVIRVKNWFDHTWSGLSGRVRETAGNIGALAVGCTLTRMATRRTT